MENIHKIECCSDLLFNCQFTIMKNKLQIISSYYELHSIDEIIKEDNNNILFHILKDLSSQLHIIHKIGIYHGRITPSNILLTNDRNINNYTYQLTDYCEYLIEDKNIKYLDINSLFYSSLNVLKNGEYNDKDDIHSVCCVVYRLIFGIPPVFNDEIKNKINEYKSSPFYVFLENLIDNNRRINSIDEFRVELERIGYKLFDNNYKEGI